MIERGKRDELLTVRLNEREFTMLREVAEQEGLGLSELVRKWIRRQHARIVADQSKRNPKK